MLIEKECMINRMRDMATSKVLVSVKCLLLQYFLFELSVYPPVECRRPISAHFSTPSPDCQLEFWCKVQMFCSILRAQSDFSAQNFHHLANLPLRRSHVLYNFLLEVFGQLANGALKWSDSVIVF